MFGLLYAEYVQGSALRTWNCVARFANVVWGKFNHLRDPIMPRSRRRHHSRSRSRSRSHSHDRDRDAKRRKVESYDSPHHRRSVSSEPEDPTDTVATALVNNGNESNPVKTSGEVFTGEVVSESHAAETSGEVAKESLAVDTSGEDADGLHAVESSGEVADESHAVDISGEVDDELHIAESSDEEANENINESVEKDLSESDVSMVTTEERPVEKVDLTATPKRTPRKATAQPKKAKRLTPKQVARRQQSEKKRLERLEEKERKKQEANKLKLIKDEQKQKEKEEKMKEKEGKIKEKEEKKKEKEVKKKEREEKEELKKKEKEQEKLEKQQKMEEKHKEKQRVEGAKLKAAAAFTKFFKKLPDNENEKLDVIIKGRVAFMPFEKKADMKLAPVIRREISAESKNGFDKLLEEQNASCLYLIELKEGKKIGKYGKTWPKQDESEDVVIIGETIKEEKHKIKKMRAKFLQFGENQRPAYYGTFRERSKNIGPRKPFGKDQEKLDYEADSDEEWEDEPEGESLKGTDDEEEDKENEGNDDYEVDNDFFVPHGHLSEDEIDDEAESRLDPEMHKAKLKLLKNEFEEERKYKMQKIRPVIVGSYWQGKIKDSTAQLSINKYLSPYSFINESGSVDIVERSCLVVGTVGKRKPKLLGLEHIPLFLKYIHGSSTKGKELIKKFIENLVAERVDVHVSQQALGKQLRKYAEWTNREEGVKKRCWLVKEQYQKKFNLDFVVNTETCKKDCVE